MEQHQIDQFAEEAAERLEEGHYFSLRTQKTDPNTVQEMRQAIDRVLHARKIPFEMVVKAHKDGTYYTYRLGKTVLPRVAEN